jgi:hypothetical protein
MVSITDGLLCFIGQVGKGRDVGLLQISEFNGKISMGNGMQVHRAAWKWGPDGRR